MKTFKKFIFLSYVFILLAFFTVGCNKIDNTNNGQYYNKTVIIHTNDVHGAIEGYSYLPTLEKEIEKEGGKVILVDAGDFTSGTIYTSYSKGEDAISLMNEVGYDIGACGNHEFDYGYDNLKSISANANFKMICSNVFENDKTIFDSEVIIDSNNTKIGFFALLTPETQTKVNPGLIKELTFSDDKSLIEIAKKEVEILKDCDVVICISHLGIDEESIGHQSYDVYNNVEGIDFIIDAHSHTIMEQGENGEPIQQTGTQFSNVGMIVIDNETKKIESNKLISTTSLMQDEDVHTHAKSIISFIDEKYGSTFATTSYLLDGLKANIRSKETNLGDLVADSMIWSVLDNTTLEVDEDSVISITNSGGIRSNIEIGNISRKDINNVLPFGNTITVNYVTGKEILEVLEASTYCTPSPVGGFPQISGFEMTINTTIPYDAGENYPDSTYCSPKSINRVTIESVNGKPFDENKIYAVISNNFIAAGGDTYYAFKRAYDEGNGFDTSILLDEALVNYIENNLHGTISEKYSTSQGRIKII